MESYIENKYKEFVNLLNSSHGKYRITDVFRDFVLMFTISIQNTFYYRQEYEDLYMQTIKKYDKCEYQIFFKLIEQLFKLFSNNDEIKDILGEIYFQIGAYSRQNQQFFTPNSVAKLLAKMQLDNNEEIKKKDIFTINDPACGSGTLLLGTANELNIKKIDYRNKVLFVAQDIDLICVCMTYIQMSIYSMPGIVIQGNTLLNEKTRIFYTPKYIVGKWYKKDSILQ